jgi:Mlc titration factor MtfA (ptsG expression regulator)
VPILGLGLESYRGFRSVLVYPREFRSKWSFEDEHGIVTEEDRVLSGEAWSDGPLVLSWEDVADAGDGYNVVIHECAHKLDMLTGEEDGVPPLPDGVDREQWERDFAAARADLAQREAAGEETAIDPYAAESAIEGFAVFSEVYFESPALLALEYPDVFDHLQRLYG